MILADKIIDLRKRAQMTQEELAEEMGVSRQSISKWEGALSTPDLNKVIKLSKVFNVSTDYLLNDEIDTLPDNIDIDYPNSQALDLETCRSYLYEKSKFAKSISQSILVFIFGVISLVISDNKIILPNLSADLRSAVGLCFLIICIAIGVALIIIANHRLQIYQFIRTGQYYLEYGVEGFIEDTLNKRSNNHSQKMILAITICILSFIPLIFLNILFENQDHVDADSWVVALWMGILSIGIYILVEESINWSTLIQLRQDPAKQRENYLQEQRKDHLAGFYWPIVVAIYLGYSLYTQDWGKSWIIWPVASMIYFAISAWPFQFTKKD